MKKDFYLYFPMPWCQNTSNDHTSETLILQDNALFTDLK